MVDESRSEIINTKPIEQGLNTFRSTFDYKGLGISDSFGTLHGISSEGIKHSRVTGSLI